MNELELKTGYVAELSNGQCLLCMRVNEPKYTKVLINSGGRWEYVSCWDNNGAYKTDTYYCNPKKDIVKIYGLVRGTTNYSSILNLDLESVKECRPVIWHAKKYITIKKSEIKEMFECDDFEIEDDD